MAKKKKVATKKVATTTAPKKTTGTKKAAPHRASTKTALRVAPIERSFSEEIQRAYCAYYLHRDELGKLAGVETVSVGPRYKDRQRQVQFAIRLHMKSEVAKNKLKSDALNGKSTLVPLYDGVPVDLVVWKCKTCSLPDGTELHSSGGGGTLGMSVTLSSGEIMWLTAAHVVSTSLSPNPQNEIDVRDSGGAVIGTVPPGDLFIRRNRLIDGALIRPATSLSPIPLDRVIDAVLPGMEGRCVAMNGAVNDSSGNIESILNSGFTLDTGERVEEHYIVNGTATVFASPGDSGAIVTECVNPKIILGHVRAVIEDDNGNPTDMTIVSQMVNVQSQLVFHV